MALTFNDTTRFPDNVSYGSSGGPGFKTEIFEGHTGVEARDIQWSIAKARYDVSYGIRDKADMDTVRAFFYAHRGRAVGFRFKDWGDFELVNEEIGTGDAATTVFQVTKRYSAGPSANDYVRTIKKLVTGTVSIEVDGNPITIGGGATQVAVNYNTGVLTFGASAVPGSGLAITVTGEFDVPVRFDTDNMQARHTGFQIEDWGSIPLVELAAAEV